MADDDFYSPDDETVTGSFSALHAAGTGEVKAYLIVLAGSRVGEMVRVGQQLVIGRGAKADLRVEDPSVSKMHVRLSSDRHGAITARDLNSRNGTFVNGERIEKAVLEDGDKIHVGAMTILKLSFADTLEESFQQQMYEAALRDPLTNLYNRRLLMEQLETEFSYSVRQRQPLSVVLIDVDGFKSLNDTHGHPTGDAVLRAVADRLRRAIRREDCPARYGGDEFAIVCRGTTAPVAMTIGERIRQMVDGEAMVDDLPELRITISVGVAGLPDAAVSDHRALLKAADDALYLAKDAGRNCVRLHMDPKR